MIRTLLVALVPVALLATEASALTKDQANTLCNREAIAMAYAAAPNYYYVRNQAELAGAEIGTALGRLIVASIVKSDCMRKRGFAPPRKPNSAPAGTGSKLKG